MSPASTRHVPSLADERSALGWLAVMREQHPVWADEAGVWHVFTHAAVREVLRDTDTFSSDLPATLAGAPTPPGNLAIDPPAHRALRALVGAAFTPRRIAALEPRIREVTRDLLDRAGDRFDLVAALAEPLPMTVIGDLLGLSDDDRAAVSGWMSAIDDAGGGADPFSAPEVMATVLAAFEPFVARMTDVAAARRAAPGDDLISALVTAEVDGEILDDQGAGTFALGLFMAGHAPTTGLLGNAVRTLDDHPELWDTLRTDPARVPAFLEEVLRLRPVGPRVQRATTRDVELAGVTIPARSVVGAWLLSANHDPTAHPDPERVDLRRGVRGGRQLGFGHGIHFCLGAPLARLEARVVVEELLARHHRLAVDHDRLPGGLDLHEHTVVAAKHLPVREVPVRPEDDRT